MRDVEQALMILRERTGLDALSFNRSGQAELVFDGSQTVRLYRIDDRTLELCAPVGELGDAPKLERVLNLLAANHLGQATGSARIAVDPEDGTIVLGERIDVAGLEAEELERRILGLLHYARPWAAGDAERIVAETFAAPRQDQGPAGHDPFVVWA